MNKKANLTMKRETIRTLADHEIKAADGGAPANCSSVAPVVCESWKQTCPFTNAK